MIKGSILLVLGTVLLLQAQAVRTCAANAPGPGTPIRGQGIISRLDSAWESQQVQEPCVLPYVSRRLVDAAAKKREGSFPPAPNSAPIQDRPPVSANGSSPLDVL
jgi:hypothetical protein